MSNFEINQAPLEGIQNGIHFLPCLISQGGPFNPEYFKPENGEVVLHGRKITESKLELPQNLLVYEKKGNTLKILHQTKQVSYWAYDVLEPPKLKKQLFDFHKSKVGLAYTQNLGESISSLDTSVDYYAAGSLDETVFLWKTPVKKETESVRLEGHSLGVVDVKFNKHQLAVSSLDSVLRVWDLDKNILKKEIVCEKMDNWKICWYQNLLCTAGEGGRVSIFDLEGQQEFEPFSVENSYATCVASDNKCIAICTDSGSLHIVDNFLAKYKLHSLQRLHKKIVRSVQFSQQGLRTLTSSDDGDIKLVDLQKMVPIRTYSGHQGSVNSIDFNPIDDNLFVSCSFDYTVRLWDTVSGQCIEQFQPFDKRDDRLWSVKFSPDGQMIGVCSQFGQLSFYQRN